jgi:NADPH:quinone reductase-like Zn-dependent oxidoreductase
MGAGFILSTAGTPQGRNVVTKSGADMVLDYKADDFKDRLRKITRETEIDVILETNCDVNMELDMDIIRPGGYIVVRTCVTS